MKSLRLKVLTTHNLSTLSKSVAMWSLRWTFRRVVSCIASAIILSVTLGMHNLPRNHYLMTGALSLSPSVILAGDSHPFPKDVSSKCRTHGFTPWIVRERTRKVYDLFLMSTELDWFEIRLHTLSPYVDYFVVVESRTTFTGKPKPLYLRDSWDRFKQFHDKIIYREVEDLVHSERVWDHEDFFRNSLFTEVFPDLAKTNARANTGDVLVVSDLDEIPRPETMALLRWCHFPDRLTLGSDFYYYSFQWRHDGPQWPGPHATTFRGPATITPNNLRQGLLGTGWAPIAAFRRWRDRATLWDAGWHCSSCFATVEEVLAKMGAFSHMALDTPENRDRPTLVNRVRNGLDLFGRIDQTYSRVTNNTDLPQYILQRYSEDGTRFRYLLDRDDENGGFVDSHQVG
jgi:beta-1,4-mannosyl-glycoprotein beta-1,4-N-acetylglucosaminyltransferase